MCKKLRKPETKTEIRWFKTKEVSKSLCFAWTYSEKLINKNLSNLRRLDCARVNLFVLDKLAPNKQNKCKCAPQRHITPKVINNCLPEEEIQLNQLSTGLRVTTLRGHDSLLAKTTTQRSRHNVGSMRNADPAGQREVAAGCSIVGLSTWFATTL